MAKSFGKITSTIGYPGTSIVSQDCSALIVDEGNEKIFYNSSLGNVTVFGFDGSEIVSYRGCAELDKDGCVVINDFDKSEKKKV